MNDTNDDLARKRFLTLGLIRLAGVAFAFLGAAFIAKRWIEPAEIIRSEEHTSELQSL